MAKTNDQKKAARRARVIASDMTIYPDIQAKIKRGIENDTLFDELADVLREAHEHFRAYVSDEIIDQTNIFERAFIDIVFANTGNIKSSIW